jgi:hypothetical protein
MDMSDITPAATVQVSPLGTGIPLPGGAWNAKAGPPAWIEFTWPNLINIEEIALTTEQHPSPCPTTHQIVYTLADGSEAFSGISETTVDGELLISTVPVQNVFRIRVLTTQTRSWVAWRSIQVFGELQSQPAPPDITGQANVTTNPVGVGSPVGGGSWNAKAGPEATVVFLWQNPVTVGQLSLIVVQSPSPGVTFHQVVATLDDGTEAVYATFSGTTNDSQLLRASGNLGNVQRLSINTLQSPSWVAWRGIQINGQVAPTPVSFGKRHVTKPFGKVESEWRRGGLQKR